MKFMEFMNHLYQNKDQNLWFFYYEIRSFIKEKGRTNSTIIKVVVYSFLVLYSLYLSFRHNNLFINNFIAISNLDLMSNLLIGFSGALLAVTAIFFSLIVFSMQVNVERMPYGLFKSLNSDKTILFYFLIIVMLAVFIGFLSLGVNKQYIFTLLITLIWCIYFIFSLLISSYKRALALINPIEQINTILKLVKRDCQFWTKASNRIKNKKKNNVTDDATSNGLETRRAAFFIRNPQWVESPKNAINYIFSLAMNHAKLGDYEAMQVAFESIIVINQYYIEAKGFTFYFQPPFFSNPLANDDFIKNTLQNYKHYYQLMLSNSDEKQIIIILGSMKKLILLYLSIDYREPIANPTHAMLALYQLNEFVENLYSHAVMFANAIIYGIHSQANIVISIIHNNIYMDQLSIIDDKIALTSAIMVSQEKSRRIALTGVECLTNIVKALLTSDFIDISILADNLMSNFLFITREVLKIKEYSYETTHSDILSHYFGTSKQNTFILWLTNIINILVNSEYVLSDFTYEDWLDFKDQIKDMGDLPVGLTKKISDVNDENKKWGGIKFTNDEVQSIISIAKSSNNDALIKKVEAKTKISHDEAERITRHVNAWSKNLWMSIKEILPLTIENRSSLTSHIVHWSSYVTILLLNVSELDISHQHYSTEAVKNAYLLGSQLIHIPDDKETIDFVANLRLTEELLRILIEINKLGCFQHLEDFKKIFISWINKLTLLKGNYRFQEAILALAYFNLLNKFDNDVFINDTKPIIQKYLEQQGIDDFIKALAKKVEDIHKDSMTVLFIEKCIKSLNEADVLKLLNNLNTIDTRNTK